MDIQQESEIRFNGVTVDSIRFDDVEEGSARPRELQFQVSIQRKQFDSPIAAQITVRLRITPLGEDSRFALELAMTGRFEQVTAASPPTLAMTEFAKYNGPALVLPFVREMVANITARSRHGLLLIPPINVVKFVDQEEKAAAT